MRLTRRFFEALLARPGASLAAALAFTALMAGIAAARVRPDFSVEMMFPERDVSKQDYDRYRADFPYDDAHPIVMVEAPDLFTPEGLGRLRALERDLANVEGVIDAESLVSAKDYVAFDIAPEGSPAGGGEQGIRVESLFPRAELSPEEIARRRRTATTDELFRWNLCPPDGRATSIRLTMAVAYASKDEGRMKFLKAARAAIARHERPGQRIVLSGMPVLRAQYTEMITKDMATLMPLATALIAALLAASFRAWRPTIAALLTIGAACIWTLGGFGVLGYPVQLLSQITPVVVMIISISDTVHIVAHYKEALGRGLGTREAIVYASADSAWPCFLTEIVIALGFLGLLAQDIAMISQFGAVTALGMILVWAANMTVLPLALWYLKPAADPASAVQETAVTGVLERVLGWIDAVTRARPGRVTLAAAAIAAAAALAGSRVGKEYYVYDDLRPESQVARDLGTLESVHGGSVPFAVLIEPRERVVRVEPPADADAVARALAPAAVRWRLARDAEAADLVVSPAAGAPSPSALDALCEATGEVASCDLGTPEGRAAFPRVLRMGSPALEPGAIALQDRIARFVEEKFPEIKQVSGIHDYFRKIHRLWIGEAAAAEEPFPRTRGAAAQELELVDRRLLRDFLSDDRAAVAVYAQVPDVGTSRMTGLLGELRETLAREERETGYRVTGTGLFVIGDGIYKNLVGGLAASLGIAVAISLATFTAVLRSWRLGLIALVPNLLPLLLTLGIMAVLGIDLKPNSVIAFSITLVIADDDTIQFLVRYRRRYLELRAAGETGDLHGRVSSETLDHSGLPMLLTTFTVTAGFLALSFSEFLALRNLGILIGVSLFTAVLADLFLTPVMMRAFRPRIEGAAPPGPPAASASEAVAAAARE